MLDIKWLRHDPQGAADQLAKRGFTLDIDAFELMETRRKALQTRLQSLQEQRNQGSKQFGQAKSRGEDITALRGQMSEIAQQMQAEQERFQQVQQQLDQWLATLPNTPHPQVPMGQNEQDNQLLREWGAPTVFDFDPQDHVAVANNGLDNESAVRLSGSRFSVLRGPLARLHRGLAQWMLDVHTQEHGYEEVYVPYLLKPEILQGTGQLPKFEEDLFAIGDGPDFYLLPTAEVPLTNLYREQILDHDQLPLRWAAHTPCFRREAGSYGRDLRGLIRQHQFDKVELVQIVPPDQADQALDQLVGHAETILQRLELPYRAMLLCSGDMGFSATRTVDLEVWLPGQNAYREISSCSQCGDFQTRRMQLRWRNDKGKPQLPHTLNGSGVAVGRALVAVLENYQQKDGSLAVPKVLQPYLGGCQQLSLR